jgi:hypothetical protein
MEEIMIGESKNTHMYGKKSLGAWRVLSGGTCYYYYQLRRVEVRYWNFYKYRKKKLKYCIFFMFLDHNAKKWIKK